MTDFATAQNCPNLFLFLTSYYSRDLLELTLSQLMNTLLTEFSLSSRSCRLSSRGIIWVIGSRSSECMSDRSMLPAGDLINIPVNKNIAWDSWYPANVEITKCEVFLSLCNWFENDAQQKVVPFFEPLNICSKESCHAKWYTARN